MQPNHLIIEKTYDAPIEKVWQAITDKQQMKDWYFDIPDFKPELNHEFSFLAGREGRQYRHLCRIVEINPVTRLAYTWRYEGMPGDSLVTFELSEPAPSQTRLTLTHTGLDSFPTEQPDFAPDSFKEGWTYFVHSSLQSFVETGVLNFEISIKAGVDKIWNIIINPNYQWAKDFGGGALAQSDWKQGASITWTDMEHNVGAKGIIEIMDTNRQLSMRYYDDVNAADGSPLGEYKETLRLEKVPGGDVKLSAFAGPISKKHLPHHASAWEAALETIRQMSEA